MEREDRVRWQIACLFIGAAIGLFLGREWGRTEHYTPPTPIIGLAKPKEVAAPAAVESFAVAMCFRDQVGVDALTDSYIVRQVVEQMSPGCLRTHLLQQIRNDGAGEATYVFLFEYAQRDVVWTLVTRGGRVEWVE